MSGKYGSIKVNNVELELLEKLEFNPGIKYNLIEEKTDPGLFWLIECHMNSSIFDGKHPSVNVSRNGNKKAQTRKANIENLDETIDLVSDTWENYRDYCRRRQKENFQEKYGRNPEDGKHRGHRFSVRCGFLNGIPRNAIAHPENMIEQTQKENLELGSNNLITEDELKELTGLIW